MQCLLESLTSQRRYTIQWYDAKIQPLAVATTSEFLRAHSHESFVAGFLTIYTSRERKVVADFAENFYMVQADK